MNTARKILVYFFVFLLFFGIFYFLQFSFPHIISTDDSFRHIKQSWLIRTEGIQKAVKEFPWLQCTIFKDFPGDPWFGYNFLLQPFTFGDLTFGAKLASVFFDALLFLGFFWLLKKFKVRGAIFWTILLFFVIDDFFSRLLMPRPYILSILLSLIGFYLLANKRYLGIFVLSLFYSFATLEAPLIIFFALSFFVLERIRAKKFDFKIPILTVLGFILGLVIRPDFPNSLYLTYFSFFNLLFLRFKGVNLDFGTEIQFPFPGLVRDYPLLFLVFTLPLLCLLLKFFQKREKEISPLHLQLVYFSLFFAALTMLVGQRFIEYWVPFAVLATAVYCETLIFPKVAQLVKDIKGFKEYNIVFSSEKIRHFYQKIYNLLRFFIIQSEKKFVKVLIQGLFLFFVVYFSLFKMINLSQGFMTPGPIIRANSYQEAADWLRENTPPGSIVLNDRWDVFPVLLFYNHYNYYCGGMDPVFMYEKDPKLYWFWRNLVSRGIMCAQQVCEGEKRKLAKERETEVYEFLKERLNGDYILLTSLYEGTDKEFDNFLSSSKKFEKVFGKGIIKIYKIN